MLCTRAERIHQSISLHYIYPTTTDTIAKEKKREKEKHLSINAYNLRGESATGPDRTDALASSAEEVPNGGGGERAEGDGRGGVRRGGAGGSSGRARSRGLGRGGHADQGRRHDGGGGGRGEDPELEGGRHFDR